MPHRPSKNDRDEDSDKTNHFFNFLSPTSLGDGTGRSSEKAAKKQNKKRKQDQLRGLKEEKKQKGGCCEFQQDTTCAIQ